MLKRSGNGDSTPMQESLVAKFAKSKAGWRKKPTTAIRQEKQLTSVLGEAAERCDENDPSKIMRLHLDTMEEVLLEKVHHHPALVKSLVVALLEFSRYVSVREPLDSAAWDATIRRLDVWKRDATMMDHHREADLQDRMGETSYLPSREELARLRSSVHAKLRELIEKDVVKRAEAVKARRLVSTAILLDNYQRSGTITNVTIAQYREMTDGIIRVKDHKSRTSYGSANLVVTDVVDFLHFYVENARPLLVKEASDTALFPAADPWEDMGEVCAMFEVRRLTPTLLRKAASTAAYSSLSEVDRRRVANHMTHRPETAYKAYAAKNRRVDATESVKRMKGIMYGEEIGTSGLASEEGGKGDVCGHGEGANDDMYGWDMKEEGIDDPARFRHDDRDSTVPSSAGALYRQQKRVLLSPDEEAAINREARHMSFKNMSVTTSHVLTFMSRKKPLFDSRSPRTVERRLRDAMKKVPLTAPDFPGRSVSRRKRRVAK